MSVYQESKVDLADLLSRKLGQTVKASDLIYGAVGVNDNVAYTANTKCRVAIAPTHATLQGASDVYYDRLDLARLADYPAPDFPPAGNIGTSVYALLTRIQTSMGITFTQDDLVETFIEDDGVNGRILLQAKPTSYGWIGQHYISLAPKPPLSGLFPRDYITWS